MDLKQSLESARAALETRFLAAGDLLALAVERIGALAATLDALTSALSPASAAETERMLARAAAQLSALPGKQQDRHATLGRLARQQTLLAESIGDMRRSLAYMRAFIVSIKITAGGIAEADAEFAVFSQEMFLRVEAGRAEVDALEHGLVKLKQELSAASRNAQSIEQHSAAMIPQVGAQLLESAAVMAKHHARIASAAASAASLARDIRKKISRILSALQIGDITRQRIEHIQFGLALPADPGLSPHDQAALDTLLFDLLTAQLGQTFSAYSAETAEIAGGLAGLARDAESLLGLRDLAYGTEDGASGGALHALEQRIEAAIGLVREIEDADTLAQNTGKAAAAAAQSLSTRLNAVQTIKTDVLYMALNTSLKSAHMGDAGRPLSAIATELRSQSAALEAIANSCASALKTLAGEAAALEQGDARDSAGEALLAAADRLREADASTERGVAALAEQGESVQTLLTRDAGQLDFETGIGSLLEQAATTLENLAAAAAPCTEAIRAPLQAMLAKLRATYTMAQERDTQTSFATHWGIGGVEEPVSPPAGGDELEDALF